MFIVKPSNTMLLPDSIILIHFNKFYKVFCLENIVPASLEDIVVVLIHPKTRSRLLRATLDLNIIFPMIAFVEIPALICKMKEPIYLLKTNMR